MSSHSHVSSIYEGGQGGFTAGVVGEHGSVSSVPGSVAAAPKEPASYSNTSPRAKTRNLGIKDKDGTLSFRSSTGRTLVRSMKHEQIETILTLAQDQYPEDYEACYRRAKSSALKGSAAAAPAVVEDKANKFLALLRHDARGEFPEIFAECLTAVQSASWGRKSEIVMLTPSLQAALVDEHCKLAAEASLIVRIQGAFAKYVRNLAIHRAEVASGSRQTRFLEDIVDIRKEARPGFHLTVLLAQQSHAWLEAALVPRGTLPELPHLFRDRCVTVVRNAAGPKPPLFDVRLTSAGRARCEREIAEVDAAMEARAVAREEETLALARQREDEGVAREKADRQRRSGVSGLGGHLKKSGAAANRKAAVELALVEVAAENLILKAETLLEADKVDLAGILEAASGGIGTIARLRKLVAAHRNVAEAAARARKINMSGSTYTQ